MTRHQFSYGLLATNHEGVGMAVTILFVGGAEP